MLTPESSFLKDLDQILTPALDINMNYTLCSSEVLVEEQVLVGRQKFRQQDIFYIKKHCHL